MKHLIKYKIFESLSNDGLRDLFLSIEDKNYKVNIVYEDDKRNNYIKKDIRINISSGANNGAFPLHEIKDDLIFAINNIKKYTNHIIIYGEKIVFNDMTFGEVVARGWDIDTYNISRIEDIKLIPDKFFSDCDDEDVFLKINIYAEYRTRLNRFMNFITKPLQ